MIWPIARADPAELSDVRGDHPRAERLPLSGSVQGVVPAAVRRPGMEGTATAGPARDHAAHRAELHERWGARDVASRLTLVTLDCTPFDIAKSASEPDARVYS